MCSAEMTPQKKRMTAPLEALLWRPSGQCKMYYSLKKKTFSVRFMGLWVNAHMM